jgi:uncharacterized membrane protein
MKLWLATTATTAAALPDAGLIRRTAEEVVGRPEFRLEPTANPRATIIAWLWDLLVWILKPFLRFFAGLWEMSPALAVVVMILLVAILFALLWHIAYSFRQAMQRRTRTMRPDELAKKSLDPRSVEIEAEEAAHRQDYIRAVRLLFRACLLRIEQTNRRGSRPGVTNREYLRRYRDTAVHDALRQLVEVIDSKWYGYGICDVQDYMRCQRAHAQLQNATGGVLHAHGA